MYGFNTMVGDNFITEGVLEFTYNYDSDISNTDSKGIKKMLENLKSKKRQ